MSEDWYQDVLDFHTVMEHCIGEGPSIPPREVRFLRRRLIEEEVKETLDALDAMDLVEIVDGIADSIVVLLGTAIAYGVDLRPVWEEVHQTNMDKYGGGKDSYGKSLKPEGWKPPDILSILQSQGYEV